MKGVLDKTRLKVPAKKFAFVTSSNDEIRSLIINSAHNVVSVLVWGWRSRQVLVGSHIFVVIVFVISPDADSLIPSNGSERRNSLWLFIVVSLFVLFFCNAQKRSDVLVRWNFWRMFAQQIFQRTSIWKVPDLYSRFWLWTETGWNHPPLRRVKATSCQLVALSTVFAMSVTELGKLPTVFNIPNSDKPIVRTRNNILELRVVKGKRDRRIMRSLWLLLCLKEPKVNLARAQQNIVRHRLKN